MNLKNYKGIQMLCLAFLLILGIASPIFAQKDNISTDETIAYINSKIKGVATVKNEKGMLVVEFYEKGKVNRVDKVPIDALNPENVEYLPTEKTVVIRCTRNECIDRKIEYPKTRGQFSRISFSGDYDAKTQKGLVNAFEHLIMMFHDNKYKSNKPFEE